MSPKKMVGLLMGAAAFVLTNASLADSGAPSDDDLRARIAELEATVDQLMETQGDAWMTEQRAEEIRGIVEDVLADADTRASLLQGGVTAGYDNGALLSSADGNWLLRVNILMQNRWVWSITDTGLANTDTNRSGFENTRTVFSLGGNVVSPDWFYKVRINVGTNGGGGRGGAATGRGTRTGTQEAYLGYTYGNSGVKVIMGQMKAPFLREELVYAEHQLGVERSLANYYFSGGDTTGLALDWRNEMFHLVGAFSNGGNTGASVATAADTEFAFTVRGEWLASGNWDQFTDFTSRRGSETAVMVGAAVHFERTEHGQANVPAGGLDSTLFTVDTSFEFDGANLFGALTFEDTDGAAADPIGFLVQGGIYFDDEWEFFGRFEYIDFDVLAGGGGTDTELSLITVGVNKYFSGHNAKWTTDVGFALDEIRAGAAAGLTGFRASNTEDGEVVLRTQWQIMF